MVNFRPSTNKTWFLQVRENWKKSEFEWSGKGQGKIFFGKVRENENQ